MNLGRTLFISANCAFRDVETEVPTLKEFSRLQPCLQQSRAKAIMGTEPEEVQGIFEDTPATF